MPRPNPPRKRPRRRPAAARADAELTRQTAQSARPQQPPSKSSGGSGGRGGGSAVAPAPDEMWSRRSYAVLVALMAATESVISLLLLGLSPGPKNAAAFVAAAIGLQQFLPITLAAGALLAAPMARRITGERRPLRFVETIVVAGVTYFVFSFLQIPASFVIASGSPSASSGAPATPLPNTSASPSATFAPSGSASATVSASSTPSPTPSPSGTPAPTAASGPIGNGSSFNISVPTAISAGQPFSVVVKAVDSHGATAQGFADGVSLTSSDATAISPTPYSFTPGDNGQHAFQFTLKAIGSQTITATNTNATSIKGKSSGIVVSGPPAKLSIVPPSSVAANDAGSVSVTIQDKGGRRVTAYSGTIRFSSSDKQAQLPKDYTFTTGDCGAGVASQPDCGKHTFNVTFSNSGPQSLSAHDVSDETLAGTASGIAVSLSEPELLAVGAFVLAISYAATVYIYPPLYKRFRSKPRPPAAAQRDGSSRK